MSVVKRQVLKASFLAYFGALIGILSHLFIYAMAFEIYGEVQFILSMIAFFVPFASLGILSLVNRFFPHFEDKNTNHHSFIPILLTVAIFGFLIFLILAFIFQDSYFKIIKLLNFDLEAFNDYNLIIILSIPFAILFGILSLHCANIKRITIPLVFTNLSWKIILPILILLFEFSLINESTVYRSVFYIHLFIFLSFIVYLYYKKEKLTLPKISKPLVNNYKSMVFFSLYGIVSSLGSILAFHIDKIMIRGLIDDYNTGIYSSFIMLSGMIMFPYNNLRNISAPMVSKAWKENDKEKISQMNKKFSRVLLASSLLIYFGMMINLDDIFKLTNNYSDFQKGLTAFLFLGLSKTIDSAFGINSIILLYSKYYYFSLVASLILAIINIGLNIYLIPLYGITGTAIATCFAIIIYNLFFYIFNLFVFGFQAFTIKTLPLIFSVLIAYFIAIQFNYDFHPLLRISVRSVIFILIGIGIIYKFKLSEEAIGIVDNGIVRFKKLFSL